MAPAILTVRDAADLDLLNPYRRKPARWRRIEVDVAGLADGERKATEEDLNRHYFACGCAEASALASAAVVGVPAWLVISRGMDGLTWLDALAALGLVFLAAGLGKGVGVLRARYRLGRVLARLRQRIAGPATRPAHSTPRPCARRSK
jgi:hypothetical protein